VLNPSIMCRPIVSCIAIVSFVLAGKSVPVPSEKPVVML
jgi:hypothetical protein